MAATNSATTAACSRRVGRGAARRRPPTSPKSFSEPTARSRRRSTLRRRRCRTASMPNWSPSARCAAHEASSSSVPPSSRRRKTVARSSTSNVASPSAPDLSTRTSRAEAVGPQQVVGRGLTGRTSGCRAGRARVEHVDADVHQRSAARERGLREPAAERRDAGAAQPPRLGVVGPPQPALVDEPLSRWTSPRRRWLKATSSTRPAVPGRRRPSRPPRRRSSAIGFSDSTCSPRSSAAIAIGACRKVGTATLTASSPSTSSRSFQRATRCGTPYSAASSRPRRPPRAPRSRRARRRPVAA